MFKVREKLCSFNKTVYEQDRDSFNYRDSLTVRVPLMSIIVSRMRKIDRGKVLNSHTGSRNDYFTYNFKYMLVSFNLVFNLDMLQYLVYT